MLIQRPGGFIRRLLLNTLLAFTPSTALVAQQAAYQPLVVREISFEGNHAISDDTLKIAIATSESAAGTNALLKLAGLGEKRYFDETEFRRDVFRLTLLYHQSGFPDARVDTTVQRSKEDVRILFRITEGRPIRVTALTVTGTDGIATGDRVARDLPLRVGDPFNRLKWQASSDSILVLLRNHGHPYGQVLRNFEVDRAQRTATVQFVAAPGPIVNVSRIDVQGTEQIDPEFVRRMLGVNTGEPFDQQALYDGQRDLYRLGLFNFVSVGLADTTGLVSDSTVVIVVRVGEGPMQRLRIGGGYGNIDCFRALTGWTSRNFMGGARSLDINAKISKLGTGDPFAMGLEHNVCPSLGDETDPERLKLNYNLSATLRQPFLLGRGSSVTFTVSGQRVSELQAFVREAVGAEIALTQQTSWDIPITISYQVSYGRTVAPPAIFCSFLNQCGVNDTVFSQRRLQSSVGIGLVRDRSNSPLDATSGSVFTANARYAGRLTGSDSLSQFAKAVVEGAIYQSLGQRTVLAYRVRVGSIVSPALGTVGHYVPPQERFYGGGPSSVRGYGQNELGPVVRVIGDSLINNTDTIVSPIGGNQIFFANAELRFPLPVAPDRLRAAVFLDIGQVYQRSDELVSFKNIRATPGAGIRIITPLGPIRLDVAYNGYAPEPGALYQQQGTQLLLVDPAFAPAAPASFLKRLRVHLSVGQAF